MSDDLDSPHLFIPGPAGVTPEVLEAMGRPMEPHYGTAFVADYNHCMDLMKQAFRASGDLYLIVGPGTASLDAAIGSALPDGARVLAPSSGWFGTRLAEMCRAHRAEVDLIEFPLGQAADPDVVAERLAAGRYDAVAVVHHETSTGVLNPLQEIAAAAKANGVLTIVDAVASLGGVALEIDEWGIDLCASVANKCLGAPPGISAITVSDAAWAAIDANPQSRSWYLDLRTWRDYRGEWTAFHPFPTTVPTSVIHAMNTSLEQILSEGLEARIARTAEVAAEVRETLRGLGFEMFAADDCASPITTSVRGHDRIDAAAFQKRLLAGYGIWISGGLADLAGKIFRIGHMGTSIDRAEVDLLLGATREIMRDVGVVAEGAGVGG